MNIDRQRARALHQLGEGERSDWHERKAHQLTARADIAEARAAGVPHTVLPEEARSPGLGTSPLAWVIGAVVFGLDTVVLAALLYVILRQRSYRQDRNSFRPNFQIIGGAVVGVIGIMATALILGRNSSNGLLGNLVGGWLGGFFPPLWPLRLLGSIPLGVLMCGWVARSRGWEFGSSATPGPDRAAPRQANHGYLFGATHDGEPVNTATGEVGANQVESVGGRPPWMMPAAIAVSTLILALAAVLIFGSRPYSHSSAPAQTSTTTSSPSSPSSAASSAPVFPVDARQTCEPGGTYPSGRTDPNVRIRGAAVSCQFAAAISGEVTYNHAHATQDFTITVHSDKRNADETVHCTPSGPLVFCTTKPAGSAEVFVKTS